MTEMTENELIAIFKKNNLKVTPQRLAVSKLVLANSTHPTAEIVFKEIEKQFPSISPATVYKILALLQEIGLITTLDFHNIHSRFDSNIALHVNIICPVCNKIIDYHSESVEEFYSKLKSEIGGKITGQRFDVYKKCNECK